MGRFLDCSHGGKTPGRSILDVGVNEALKDAGFNQQAFIDRGGIFDWSRVEETSDW
jgi:radical S-adenosyl methionine domain-containing protein 2